MANLSAYALVDIDEFKEWLGEPEGDAKDEIMRSAINSASDRIENYLGRHIISRGSITEYHTFTSGNQDYDLYTKQWPIISVTSVHEDTNRGYGADYLLTVNTDYIVIQPEGVLIRTNSSTSEQQLWSTGFRAIKVVYTAGYATRDDVPNGLKRICLNFAAEIYKEITRQNFGMSDISDSVGSYKRFGPAILTSGMEKELDFYRRYTFGADTWQQDA